MTKGLTQQGLPNGNHVAGVEPAGGTAGHRRRSIPDDAREARWTAPDGHVIRRFDWAAGAGARGSLLFLPGRGDAYEKYLEAFGEWHDARWAVTALDWRGQAGSGRLGRDAFTGHVEDFRQWIDDLAAFWQEWRAAAPAPHVLVAHSMGGHLALRAVAENRVRPAALVLSAPMLGFVGPPLPVFMLHHVARAMCRMGDAARPAWRWSEKPGAVPAARQELLTHDADRYADELWWRDARPDLAMGPGSWGWVERAYASMRALFAPGVLERIDIPVLILAAEHDRLVDYRAIAVAARRIPGATLMRFGPEARHELLREADGVRGRAMAAIAGFLDRAAAPAR
ncbi:alpha/beta hydrolase [Erythrobacteraceae bacterium CFH 75059]|uniref:alpha/beta hydrolase n=1 Tax=Qipengyuania thermophila TaxID=2509361 RepID=UPI00102046C9|nr:alpha/beta hydrolase [Qipengyuania thermophila]TCD06217.1 alpha/beta hydrolase [Erythrobacteraceae bacterium CFH 75059]